MRMIVVLHLVSRSLMTDSTYPIGIFLIKESSVYPKDLSESLFYKKAMKEGSHGPF